MMNAAERLDHQLLQTYARTRCGHGDYSGEFWFVGKEEGGGRSVREISRRLDLWREQGQNELDDLREFHLKLGVRQYFAPPVKDQRTWGGLLQIMLGARDEGVVTRGRADYQANCLGRREGNTCLLELLPLPSPSGTKWIYASCTDLLQLASRTRYRRYYAEPRSLHIAERVKEHRPKAVIFYSIEAWYFQWWRRIAGIELMPVNDSELYIGTTGTTVFAVIRHPSMGVSHESLRRTGTLIRQLMRSS